MPVDIALQTQHDLLIVEEAGSLPVAVLLKLMQLSNKIVFATTVQGYEGAGRGFATRFAQKLDELQADWLKLTPIEPIRWSTGDPVEAFVNDALMLNATTPTLKNAKQLNASVSSVRLITQQEMLNDEVLLESIFGLLLSAHYQTTPSDLRHMLDQPKVQVFAQFCHGELTGAALLAIEGDIESALHEPIVKKQRRLADQVLPQVFAQACGKSTILSATYARIVRIAIHPELHRHGFGSQLFTQLCEQLSPNTIIGASFGADESSLSFWLSLGCSPIHYGFKVNPRSGQRAVCVLLDTSGNHRSSIDRAGCVLALNLQALASTNTGTNPVMTLLSNALTNTEGKLDSEQAWQLITDYAQAHRSFADTAGLLSTHRAITAEPPVHQQVLTAMHSLNKLPPKKRREQDIALRLALKSRFGL